MSRLCCPFPSLSSVRCFYSSRDKKYAHYISEASWAGARIIQGQWTPQAQSLYDLIIQLFSENGKLADLGALKKKSGVNDEEWEDLLQYSSQVRVRLHSSLSGSNSGIVNQVLSNLVNYKSFGFTKFIPRIPKEKFEAVVKASSNAPNTLGTWETVRIYDRADARCRV